MIEADESLALTISTLHDMFVMASNLMNRFAFEVLDIYGVHNLSFRCCLIILHIPSVRKREPSRCFTEQVSKQCKCAENCELSAYTPGE